MSGQPDIFDHAYPVQLDFEVDCDISAGSVKIEYIKPVSGTTGSWTASVDDGPNGLCHYTTLEDNLDEVGIWKLQAVHYPVGSNDGVPGSIVRLEVKERNKAIT